MSPDENLIRTMYPVDSLEDAGIDISNYEEYTDDDIPNEKIKEWLEWFR